jgi:hypothetical protein
MKMISPRHVCILLPIILLSCGTWTVDSAPALQNGETNILTGGSPSSLSPSPSQDASSAPTAKNPNPQAVTESSGLKTLFDLENARLVKAFPPLKGLEINPQIVSAANGKGSTFGLSYKYNRDLIPFPDSISSDFSLSLHSEGLYALDPKSVNNNVFTHSLKLSWIDIVPPRKGGESKVSQALADRLGHDEDRWSQAQDANQKEAALYEAESDLRLYESETKFTGSSTLVEKADGLYVKDKGGKTTFLEDFIQQLKGVKPRIIFLSLDLNGNMEHDQALTNLQFVGSFEVRGKFLEPQRYDPFGLIRLLTSGDSNIKDWHNLAGGPLFWAGIGMVDGSQNQSRTSLTTEHEIFPRANVGVYYRTELYGISSTESLALELNWEFYNEFGAPGAIKAHHLDTTSYFKATILFPLTKAGNTFVEYSDGKLPTDVNNGQTVSAGWRYNF